MNKYNCTSSPFQFGCLISCLIALARTSNMMLNRSSESKYLCLSLNFRAKTFSLSPLSIVLAVVFFIDVLYQVRFPFSLSNFFFNVMKNCCILSNASAPAEMIIQYFFFILVFYDWCFRCFTSLVAFIASWKIFLVFGFDSLIIMSVCESFCVYLSWGLVSFLDTIFMSLSNLMFSSYFFR